MMNNITGPDKGLLDVIFGGGAQGAEAKIAQASPASGMPAAPAEGVPMDFSQALVQAQDQPAVNLMQPKGGSKQVLKPEAVLVAKADAELQAAPIQGKKKPQKEELASDLSAAAAVVSSAPVAQAVAAPVAPKAPEAKPVEALEVKPAGKPGPKAPAAGLTASTPVQASAKDATAGAQAQAASEIAATQAVATAVSPVSVPAPKRMIGRSAAELAIQPEATQAMAAAKMAAMVTAAAPKSAAPKAEGSSATSPVAQQQTQQQVQQSAPQATVAQPNVIPMPMAAPVVVETGSDVKPVTAPGRAGSTKLLASQDFVTNLRQLRTSAETMPVRPEGEQLTSQGDTLLVLPQVTGSSVQAADASVGQAGATQPMPAPRVDVANPMAVAAQINGLAVRGGGTVRVKVNPENLGELTIAVQSRGRKLDVRLETSSEQAREALLGAMPELKQVLRSARYDVGTIEVNQSSSQAMQWASASGDALAMGQVSSRSFFSASDFGSGHNGQGSFSHDGSGNQGSSGNGSGNNGRGWDRYFAQQDGGDSYGDNRHSAYRRYQQAAQLMQ